MKYVVVSDSDVHAAWTEIRRALCQEVARQIGAEIELLNLGYAAKRETRASVRALTWVRDALLGEEFRVLTESEWKTFTDLMPPSETEKQP